MWKLLLIEFPPFHFFSRVPFFKIIITFSPQTVTASILVLKTFKQVYTTPDFWQLGLEEKKKVVFLLF